MATDDLGRWEPLGLDAVDAVMAGAGFAWWIAGGHALELHLGRSWRVHADVDVGIRRRDAGLLFEHVTALPGGWEIAVAAAGRLHPWDGRPLVEARHENNLWCRRTGGPWLLDVLVGSGDDEAWCYRRDPGWTLPWDRAVLRTGDGRRYLAPDLQLLFKSSSPRPHDDLDAREVIPVLDAEHVAVLRARLPADHPWQPLVAARERELRRG